MKNVLILVPDDDLYNGKVVHKVKTNIYIYIYVLAIVPDCCLTINENLKLTEEKRLVRYLNDLLLAIPSLS